MTDLIVALDGPEPFKLAQNLVEVGVAWFKVGPQMMCNLDWPEFTECARSWPEHIRIFLDLKLADTGDAVREAVKRFADAGIAAVSTFTKAATIAACEAAAGTSLKVWQLVALTDNRTHCDSRKLCAHGVICPGYFARTYDGAGVDIVVPGVRFKGTEANGHSMVTTPQQCVVRGITHAVVGRPIWQATDPVAAAREFIAALAAPEHARSTRDE